MISKKLTLLILLIVLLLPNCYRAKLIEIKLPKPSPPQLKQILIDTNIDCNKDKKMCDIIFNFEQLLLYVCELEYSPLWESGSELLCQE